MFFHNVKVVVIGETDAGKTAILHRFSTGEFGEDKKTTIGIDFIQRSYKMKDATTINLRIWDTAGQERYQSLYKSYLRDANVAIVVFDLTDPLAHQHVTKWLNYVDSEKGEETSIYLVGNKADRKGNRKPSNAVLRKLTTQLSLPYMETSALNGQNIEELFEAVAHLQYPELKAKTQNNISLGFSRSVKSAIQDCSC